MVIGFLHMKVEGTSTTITFLEIILDNQITHR